MPELRRVTIGDTLRALSGTEHSPAAREVATIVQVKRVATALDQIVNRVHDFEHFSLMPTSEFRTANEADLSEADRLTDVLKLAYQCASAMTTAMRAQKSRPEPTIVPAPEPPIELPSPPPTKQESGLARAGQRR